MSLRKNVISNFILTSSTILFPLITFPYITRTLSNVSIGKVFFIDAFTQYFIIFSTIGIPLYGVREIAKLKNDLQKRSNLVVELVIVQVLLSIIFILGYITLYYFIPSLKGTFNLIKIGCLGIIASSFLIEWYYQGIENFSYITIRSLIIKSVSVVLILVLVKNHDDYELYYFILTAVILFNAGLNFLNFLKKHFLSYNGGLSLKQHIKPLLVLFSINVSVSVYTIFDTILLGLFTDPVNVSYYSVPLKLVKMYWMVVSGVGAVLIPRMSTLYISNDIIAIRDLMQKSFSIVFLLTIPFCGFCLMFPLEIMRLISGNKYTNATMALQLLSVVPLIIGICNVLGTQFLLPIGKESKILQATIIGLIVSLSLNFLLIPQFKFIGSSISCVIAELSVCTYILLHAKRNVKISIDYKILIQILISIIISFIPTYFLKTYLHNLFLLVCYVVIYLFIFIVLQVSVFRNKFIYSLLNINK